ncbi:MAG TPA: DUF2147 domain-containing protein [Flavobacterium sp.]|jgi:uncharacterized protein (DUF2147 family)
MRKFVLTFILLLPLFFSHGQSVLGRWKSIDDITGKTVGIVEIYEKNGKIYGKIVEILIEKDKDKMCEMCAGNDKGKPILGLVILKGLQKDGDEYNGGHILDPKQGKLYKCYITAEGPDKLKVRGYIGFSLLGRTQYWHRVK